MDFLEIKSWLNYRYSTSKYSKRLYIVENIFNYLQFELDKMEYKIEDKKTFYLDLIHYILKYSYLDKKVNINIRLNVSKINDNFNEIFIDDLFYNLENYIEDNGIQILNKYDSNKINDFYNLIMSNILIPEHEQFDEEDNSDNDFVYVD
jgi:hypothetical protein